MPKIEIEKSVADLTLGYSIDYKIEVIDITNIDYNYFFENFLMKNLPCIIKNITRSWECAHKWVKNGTINFDYFITTYGHLEAPVANCDLFNFNAQCKRNMNVSDYMEYLQSAKKDDILYLKDWHLQKLQRGKRFYEVPFIFASDWLNELATDLDEDDFMFVYIGPQKSWTPLHADVYNSYSWSVNVVGKKQWIFFPPGEEEKIKDDLGNLPLMFESEKYENVTYFEVLQESGDALFVPSGWHHQVINLVDTISINHNWVNGCNIQAMWSSFEKSLISVEREISDLKNSSEFVNECQTILKSLFGMDLAGFVRFLFYIGEKRINQLYDNNKIRSYIFELGKNHILFDIKTVSKTINLIQNHPIFSNKILSNDKKSDIIEIQRKIKEILNSYCL